MSEHDNDDDRYYLTLHVDLLNTALEDFIAHVEDGFIVRRLAHLGLKEKTAGQWQEVKDWPPTPVDRITKGNIWNLSADSGQTLIGTTITQKGNLSCVWFVYYPTQGGQRWSVIERPKSGKSDFRLEATHYRRDRLNIVMWESPKDDPVLGEYLLGWMMRYWRKDGIDNLLARGVQSPDPPNENRPLSYGDKTARSTLVHHLVTKYKQEVNFALGLVDDITKATYLNHVGKGLLLSEEDFARQWGQENTWSTKNQTLDGEARGLLGLP